MSAGDVTLAVHAGAFPAGVAAAAVLKDGVTYLAGSPAPPAAGDVIAVVDAPSPRPASIASSSSSARLTSSPAAAHRAPASAPARTL